MLKIPTQNAVETVSVIIPVLNQRVGTLRLVDFFLAQETDVLIEIVVVDNGSDDGLVEELAKRDDSRIRCVVQDRVKSPYVSRNLGVQIASGKYLVLIDAHCLPVGSDWLQAALQFMKENEVDIVVGEFGFQFAGPEPTLPELLESVMYFDSAATVKQGGAAAAMLFTRKNVFDRFGMFPDFLRSNGDTVWTTNVTSRGGKIAFAQNLKIEYTAKRGNGLARKQLRIGFGNRQVWLSQGHSKTYILLRAIWNMRPLRPEYVLEKLKRSEPAFCDRHGFLRIYGYACYLNFLKGVGRLGFSSFLSVRSD